MKDKRTTISLENLLKDHDRVAKEAIVISNHRIKVVMKKTVRDFQKKQRTSLEKASQIVLNA